MRSRLFIGMKTTVLGGFGPVILSRPNLLHKVAMVQNKGEGWSFRYACQKVGIKYRHNNNVILIEEIVSRV